MPTDSRKTNDPQTTVFSKVKKTAVGEMLVFTIPIGELYEIVAMANIPDEDQDGASVYLKHRLRRSPLKYVARSDRPAEERDPRRDGDTDGGNRSAHPLDGAEEESD